MSAYYSKRHLRAHHLLSDTLPFEFCVRRLRTGVDARWILPPATLSYDKRLLAM
jgi:hypothetical protein